MNKKVLILIVISLISLSQQTRNGYAVEIPPCPGGANFDDAESYIILYNWKDQDSNWPDFVNQWLGCGVDHDVLTDYSSCNPNILYAIVYEDNDQSGIYSHQFFKDGNHSYRAFKPYTLLMLDKKPLKFKSYVVWDLTRDCHSVTKMKIKFFNCNDEAEAFYNRKIAEEDPDYIFWYDSDLDHATNMAEGRFTGSSGSNPILQPPFDEDSISNDNEKTFREVFYTLDIKTYRPESYCVVDQ